MYKLHSFCQSGNSYKVALTLNLLGQPWEPVFVDFMAGVTQSPAWRAEFNEMGELPVLQDGALRLTQSGMILVHLAAKHGRFGGRNEDERREILRWILFDNHKFSSYFVSYRWLKSFEDTPPDPAVMAWLKGRIDHAFGVVDAHLASRAFLLGGEPTIADFSLCGYLYFPREESGYDLPVQFPRMAAWLERIRALPGWQHPYDCLPGKRLAPRW